MFSLFLFSLFNCRRGKTQPSALVLDYFTFSGYWSHLKSALKSLLRGNKVEDFSADLRARGVFVLGANVQFAYQQTSITKVTKSARPNWPRALMTSMAVSGEYTDGTATVGFVLRLERWDSTFQSIYYVLVDAITPARLSGHLLSSIRPCMSRLQSSSVCTSTLVEILDGIHVFQSISPWLPHLTYFCLAQVEPMISQGMTMRHMAQKQPRCCS